MSNTKKIHTGRFKEQRGSRTVTQAARQRLNIDDNETEKETGSGEETVRGTNVYKKNIPKCGIVSVRNSQDREMNSNVGVCELDV